MHLILVHCRWLCFSLGIALASLHRNVAGFRITNLNPSHNECATIQLDIFFNKLSFVGKTWRIWNHCGVSFGWIWPIHWFSGVDFGPKSQFSRMFLRSKIVERFVYVDKEERIKFLTPPSVHLSCSQPPLTPPFTPTPNLLSFITIRSACFHSSSFRHNGGAGETEQEEGGGR